MVLSMLVSALLSGVFQVLFDRLASRQVIEFFQFWSFDEKLLDELKIVGLTVDAVLRDAEEQQITNLAVKEWVNRLEDAAYHAEDLMDEIDTLALQHDLETKGKAKGKAKVNENQPNQVRHKPGKNIESRLKKIVEDLESLAKQRDILNLKRSVGGKPAPMLPTTSLVNESEVFGRGTQKDELKRYLRTVNALENRIPVIAILGIGGVGKTTLAQLLYNDSDVMKDFELRAWAYVSEEFDVFKATKTIYESVTLEDCNVIDLNLLQIKLQEKLKGKKFLLILDNIWNEKYIDWDLMSSPLKDGAPGSRIVVTTRSQRVAALMGAFVTYPLSHLSDEDCWLLLAKHAFGTSNYEGPFKSIGEKIVKKCNGLPLAAKTLGGLLRSKKKDEEWERILNSKIWDLPEDNSILPALRLSYYYLPSHLKQCFNYCSIFPKGYEFKQEKLIMLWMAEGFLRQPIDKEETMEQLGREYSRELLSRSFFQQSRHSEDCFVMHDLVNDLAQCMSGEFCCKFDEGELLLSGVSKKTRHLSFKEGGVVSKKEGGYGLEKFKDLVELKSLRTFLPLTFAIHKRRNLPKLVSDLWLPGLKHLRVLSFSCYAITMLPNSLDQLIHLRYLDLSQTLIKELPSSMPFINLQTLLLSKCRRLTVLQAESLIRLIHLRHLDLSETGIKELPSSMPCINLQTLLLSKCGQLAVLRAESVVHLIHLRHLDLSETGITELPSSMPFINLQTLLLSKCHQLAVLPAESLVRLIHLRHLDLSETRITELPSSMPFINLQTLLLSKCRQLAVLQAESLARLIHLRHLDLSETGITELPSSMPFINLQTLLLSKCSQLAVLPAESLVRLIHLRHLDLSETGITELPSSMPFINLQTLLLSKCSQLAVLPAESLVHLIHLRHLDLSETGITEVPSSTCSLKHLQTLLLIKCPNLTVLPEKIEEINLRRLDVTGTNIRQMPELKPNTEVIKN